MLPFPLGKTMGVERLGDMVASSMFSFLRNSGTVLQVDLQLILHSHQECIRVPVLPHPYQHLVWSVF